MTKLRAIFGCIIGIFFLSACGDSPNIEKRITYAQKIEVSLQDHILKPWYPKTVDEEFGGFLSSVNYKFEPGQEQIKMIVSQARHVWVNSKAAKRYPEMEHYSKSAAHGFKFLKEKMWDDEFGGFHTFVSRQGEVIDQELVKKTAYGNAFAIYALAAYYDATGDEEALELAREAFLWLEEHSHDKQYLGYFQHLGRDGTPIPRSDDMPSTSDVGYKDQNSSIHLLEAFTGLYRVWPDALVAKRLEEMLVLIRDTITNEKGSLVLFFEPDWTPISFRDSSKEDIDLHYYLDHVSFGHDVETAFLMIEASHALGIDNDLKTYQVAKKMVDHSLSTGFDNHLGGFYDGGYYFTGDDSVTIIRDTKTWWTQAEGLNALLLMAEIYPDDEMDYFKKFEKQWSYIDVYLVDHENGGWYEGGLDKQPEIKKSNKGHIWKTTYHNYRALINCVDMLMGDFKLVN